MESAMNSRVINAGGTHGRVTRTLYRALLRSGRTVRHAFAMSFCCGCAARRSRRARCPKRAHGARTATESQPVSRVFVDDSGSTSTKWLNSTVRASSPASSRLLASGHAAAGKAPRICC